MSKEIYVVDCYTCQHNGQETCKGCNTLLNGDVEPYENWELREDLSQKDQRIAELEQELAELKEKDNYHLRYELAGADETITNLKEQLAEKDIRIEELEGQFAYECECNKQLVELQKQLEEKQNTINEINKEFVQAVHDWKALCAEKDKEIEKLKQQYTILENENGKLTTELIMDKYKKAQKEVSFGKQLAIQELEKVKILIQNAISFEKPNFVEVYDVINKQIKELSNNTFKCEICGEITPKNCEGGEPNVCAGCVPVETHDLRLHIEPQSHENNFLD